ncbi:MAG: helix-turn-helix domain-containing protein [Streptosporangiaceae bacterium]|jgi:transcriptional regulator GlxA family with amidase domain
MHRVVVLAIDGVYPFELGMPSRIFGSPPVADRYDVLTCGLGTPTVQTSTDFSITVEHGPEILATADTVVIPAFDAERVAQRLTSPLAAALSHIRPGTRVMSICTGAFVLAAAGLLDGRPATTHWMLADDFRRWFPKVRLDPDVLFVDDGDILTSAGAASGMDLCLHVLRRDHGHEVANLVARGIVVPPWRDGGQAQYIERPLPPASGLGTSPTRDWALRNLRLPLTMTDLAQHAQMSPRTFARKFRDETGVSPGHWLTRQRISRARHLLESTDLSVDQIASEVGFATATSLRQHMHATIGVAPLAYRRTFQAAKLPVPVVLSARRLNDSGHDPAVLSDLPVTDKPELLVG